jgi:hypothetical protein
MTYSDNTTALLEAETRIGKLVELFLSSDLQVAATREFLNSLKNVQDFVDKSFVESLLREIAGKIHITPV